MHAILLVALVALFPPPAPPGALPAGQPVAVSGIVTDASGLPVPGATVQIEIGGAVAAEAETGVDGRFTLPAATSENTRVTVTAPGFARRVVLVADPSRSLTIQLEPAPFFDAVQVTSSRGTRDDADATVAVSVLPAADLITGGALAVDDALKVVPGFTLFPSSRVANPTVQTMMLRGMGGSGVSRSLVLADGVPLNDAFGGWVYWDKVPHAAIDRIEVLRGGGSDLYGADAVGGVVQVLTTEPVRPMARVLIEGGSLDTGRISAFGGGRTDRWIVTGGGQWFSTEGYVLVVPAERGAVDRPSGSRHQSGMVSATYATAGGWRFGARGNVFAENRNNGTVLQVNDTRSVLASGQALGPAGGGFLAVHVFGNTQEYEQTFSAIEVEPPRSAEYLTLVQRVPTTSGGASAQWSRQWGRTNVLVGGEARVSEGHAVETRYAPVAHTGPADAGGTARLGSAFVRMQWPATDLLTLVAGAHVDAWHSGSRTSSVEQFAGAFNPRVAVAYRIGDTGIAIRGAAFGGFRPPTLNELFRAFQVGNDVTLPNDALTPERMTGVEAGVSASRGPASLRLTGFWSVLNDVVTNVTVSTSPSLNLRHRENADRLRSQGLELEGDLRLTSGLSLMVTSALIDSRFKGDTPLRGFRVPQVAQYSVAATLRYRDPSWTASSQWRLTGPQFDDDVNTRVMRRASVLDAFVGRTLGRHLMAFAAAENLLDASYDVGRIPVRLIGLPRAVRAGVQVVLP